ncbi:MAG: S41 family peptidase [Candidatus Wallbacteria bacterium]
MISYEQIRKRLNIDFIPREKKNEIETAKTDIPVIKPVEIKKESASFSQKFLSGTLLMIAAGMMFFTVSAAKAGTADIGSLDNLNVVRKVFNLIKSDYVRKDVNENDLLKGAINGMLESLNDPYSRYMEPKNFKDMQDDTSGEFEGVGLVITVKNRIITIVSPIDDTPAFKAGLKSGDRIIKIDGVDTDKLRLHEAVNKMRGKKGEAITLTIWRNEFKEPKNFTLYRDTIPLRTVSGRLVDDKIGYVRISQFTESTAPDLEKELVKLEGKGINALILDLRDNPGGLLTAAIDVSRKFLDKGTVVTVKSRDGKTLNLSSYYRSHPDYPMVVLINKGSASSSEIVSGAIQDNNRAIIIGNKSFGKGVIQTVIPMENNAGLILTTAWYFTPSGRSIHHKGIDPDIIIDQPTLTDEQVASIYDSPKNIGGGTIENNVQKENSIDKRMAAYGVKPYDRQLISAIKILSAEKMISTSIYDGVTNKNKELASGADDGNEN